MRDKVGKQMWDILEAKDREALEALYRDAFEKEDWKQAHDHLLEFTLKILEHSATIIANMRWRQEAIASEMKVVEGQLESLIADFGGSPSLK